MKQDKNITVARYIVSFIEKTGIDIVPVIQGGAIMKVIDELGQSKKLKYICPNHEQALAMMVDAYARIKGFGVGMATSGPGGINLATGIACAYYDSIPCMFITGQVGMFHVTGKKKVRQRGFQETDIVSVLKPVTKYAVLLKDAKDARYEFEKAYYLAKSGRPGPVVIDVPYNVQREKINPAKLRHFILPVENSKKIFAATKKAVETVLRDLRKCERPIILAGGGVRLAGQVGVLRKLAHKLHLPVVTTWGGIDYFEPDDKFYLGNIGRTGNKSAVQAVQQSDLLISLGARFTSKEIIDEKLFAKDAKIISIDVDRAELVEGLINPHIKFNSDLKHFLPAILKASARLRLEHVKSWLKETDELKRKWYKIDATRAGSLGKYVSPYRFGEALSSVMRPGDIFLPDCGVNLMWMAQSFRLKYGQRFMTSWGCSPMSYAFPASLGAKLAKKNANVVATIGDGSMQMNIQELQTAVFNKIPVKVFVFNNRCYASIRHPAKSLFEGRAYGTDEKTGYCPPDFLKIARAYGWKAFSFGPKDNLRKKIKKILAMSGPVLVEVPVDPEQFVFENTDLIPEVPK